jgi:arylsulfatase A-like enzyme/Tfp pilus assembly protein PilF
MTARLQNSGSLGRALPGALAFALLALACNRIGHQAAPPPPSVLLVTIDTLRADHVGAYGASRAETPTLDALAARGVRFDTVIAPTPITLPSHTSLLTGTRPPRHGVRHNGSFRLRADLPTLAERLRGHGYVTAAVVGSVVLDARHGLDRGFDHYDDEVARAVARKAGATGYAERSATEVAEAAIAWLADLEREPFFLWVHFYDPHLDHRAPPPFAERLADRPYDAEVAYVDHELGRLLAALEASGRLERTLVAVTSDHGESLGEHGETSHGMTLYDAALRVPWLLAGPEVPAGRVVSGIARSIDVAPTLLALVGAPPLGDADGDDLSGALAHSVLAAGREAYAETLLPALDYGFAPLHAVRNAEYLYVRAPRPELYVLADDPHQLDDRSRRPEAAATMAALDARVARFLAETTEEVERIALDPDERARLRSLGYALPEDSVDVTGLDPKDGLRLQPHVQRAARALAEARYAEAERDLRAFLDRAPRSARAHGLLASVLLYTGRASEALEHANRAVALDDRPSHRFTLRAEIRIVMGDHVGAVRDFEHAIAIDPDDAQAQVGMLWVRAREGDLATAARHAQRAFALAPGDAFLRWRVGAIWLEVGARARAIESFERAVALRPDYEMAHAWLAIELTRAGRAEAARGHEARAGDLLAEPRLGGELAVAEAAAGDLVGASARLAELERRHPGDRHVARARARVTRFGDLRRAAERPEEERT